MNLDHDFVQVNKLSEDQKKSLYQKWNTFFPQIQVKTKKRSSPKLENTFFPEFKWTPIRSHALPSQIIGGNVDVDHTQTIGEDTAKLLGDTSPHSVGFRHPCYAG